MADVLNFHDAFIDGLKDTYDAERQVARTLPMLAEAVTSPDLRRAFESYIDETRDHVTRLEQIFWLLDEPARGKHCASVAAILEEGAAVLAQEVDDDEMDARLLASAQRVEQYERSAYTTLAAWAAAMAPPEVAGLLQLTLDEETGTEQALATLMEARHVSVATTRSSAARR